MTVRDFFVFLLFFFDLLPYGGCFTLPPRPRCCRCAVAGGPPRAPPPQRKAPARARRRLTGGAAALPEVVIFSEALDPLGPAALTLGLGVGAVLGLLGGGGSILALPCFLYAFKEPPDVAMAESLAVVAIGALTGFLYKARPLPSAVPMEKSSTSFSSSSTATEEDRDCQGDAAYSHRDRSFFWISRRCLEHWCGRPIHHWRFGRRGIAGTISCRRVLGFACHVFGWDHWRDGLGSYSCVSAHEV